MALGALGFPPPPAAHSPPAPSGAGSCHVQLKSIQGQRSPCLPGAGGCLTPAGPQHPAGCRSIVHDLPRDSVPAFHQRQRTKPPHQPTTEAAGSSQPEPLRSLATPLAPRSCPSPQGERDVDFQLPKAQQSIGLHTAELAEIQKHAAREAHHCHTPRHHGDGPWGAPAWKPLAPGSPKGDPKQLLPHPKAQHSPNTHGLGIASARTCVEEK